MAKIVINENGCWIFQGYKTPAGYGRLCTGKHQQTDTAHVLAYQEFVGPIPEGKELHHICDEKSCANPEHLEPLTRTEHQIRHRRRAHCRNGHAMKVRNVYVTPEGKPRCRACRKKAYRRWWKKANVTTALQSQNGGRQ